jgi:hypothetical protein
MQPKPKDDEKERGVMTRGIPESLPVTVIEELEATIRDLILLMDTVRRGSVEYRMIIRQLIGVRDGNTGRSLSNNSLKNLKCCL